MKILELNNIHKSYGATKALNGVSFSVPKGSIFGILGPNGSGKTTLLSIILDVLKANDGSYTWLSETTSAVQRQSIGSLLETPNFYHYLSASRNLEITRQISGRGSAGDIDIALKKVKLYDRRGSKFSTYSLGMKQRLAIGAALLGLPSILVLDEPTNGLDPVGIVEIRELILELNANGHTIIIASHLLDEVEKICTHVAIMKFGNLLTCGPVDEVMANDDCVEVGADNTEALLIVMGKYPCVLNISTEKDLVVVGLPKGTADLEEINSFCFNSGIVLNHLYMRKQKLETRFFELTQN